MGDESILSNTLDHGPRGTARSKVEAELALIVYCDGDTIALHLSHPLLQSFRAWKECRRCPRPRNIRPW